MTIQRVQDVRRTLDYLENRPDIDDDSFGYFGYSWGANQGPIVLAVEPRFAVAVLYIAGFLIADPRLVPAANSATFLSRVRQPVLQLSGEYDGFFPLETTARPFFAALGSADKELIVDWGAHFVDQEKLIGESLRWLEQHLGPAN